MNFPLLLGLLLITSSALAVDFDQTLSLPKRTENKVFRTNIKPMWLPDGERFWYKVQTSPKVSEHVLVNAVTGVVQRAPELRSLKLPEDKATRTSTLKVAPHPSKASDTPITLKLVNELSAEVELYWISPEGKHVRYGAVRPKSERELDTYAGHVWLLTNRTGEHLAVFDTPTLPATVLIDGKGINAVPETTSPKKPKITGSPSPDKRWEAIIDQGVIKLKDTKSDTVRPLPTGLSDRHQFRGAVTWAPNSSAFVVSCGLPVPSRKLFFVESLPKDGLQPKLHERDYPKPGDPLPQPFPVIFRIKPDGHDWIQVKNDLFPNAFNISGELRFHWSADAREVFFDYNQRGHQVFRIIGVNAVTGATRTVVEETSKSFIDYTQKTWRHWLPKTGELLWMSERSGWCHLYLVDVQTGKTKNAATSGTWPVREVLHVDDQAREVWFMASGLRKDEDPYHLHLCRVKLDGTGFAQLTEGDGIHRIEFSPDRKHFIDTWSRADHPPVTELRRSKDGTRVCELERADASALLAAQWTLPERFTAKGRDGKTDIHGVIIKPSHFDPTKKYPVLEEIYAGPHSAFAPKEFGRLMRQHQMAELGFIVVQADGMGTNHRGKAFHDVSWKNLKDAGFPDRIAWIKSAAASRPWMDLTRVGIYGGSAGGQNAMRALLDHHDFYKAAVADCGCHDNRMDKIWWNEQWMGWPVDESYVRSSNVADAHKLLGKLLLIVGELDSNVDPASTMQVVSALQKAGKSFEFMPIAGTGHGAAETPFGARLRMEFLVKHLLHPPTP